MAAEGAACSDRPRLGHVVSVLSDGFLRYNTVGRIEHAVLANAVKLLGEDVNTFTLYDRRGLLRRHFSSTYGGCFRRAILDRQGCKDITQRFGDYLEVSADFDGHHEMSNEGKSSYFLESADGKLLLSQFDPSHHSSQRGIRLCFLDQSCAHRRVLSSKIRRYSLSDDWVVSPGVYVGGIELKYRIPPGEHISQPDLQRQLYLVDGAELPPPELVVSVQPGLRDVMRFCAGFALLHNFRALG
ncbi:amphioxus-specific nk homeobox protein [Babesia caballi]|uniref:Amphioxus-specific nk homeobox protein n=1 Tax=Babesia caballi TaxID=5871 RepID=A0AAV4LVL0_BABCB|nr:amphioxus-specific nk homeobox protein [Babesia caballi]